MAYRIDYNQSTNNRKNSPFRWQMPLLTCIFFLLFSLCIKTVWPEGSNALRQLLLPHSNSTVSETAFQIFVSNLKNDQPFYESLTAFCQQIIAHAQLTPA